MMAIARIGNHMQIIPIYIEIMRPPKDHLLAKIERAKPAIKSGDIIAITSKVVSIWQGRCMLKSAVADKDDLIRKEADHYLDRENVPGGHVIHTLKNNLLIPSAGIDESNAAGYYILWPKDPEKSARRILSFFRRRYGVKNCGVIITDSRSMPFRRGVVGVAIGWAGFDPLYDYRGKKDLFGRELRVSQTNVADALAAAAVFAMGEGAEQTPMVIIRDAPRIRFFSGEPRARRRVHGSFIVSMRDDLFAPFLRGVRWKRGGGAKRNGGSRTRKHKKIVNQ